MCTGREWCMFTKETPGQLVPEKPGWAGRCVTKQHYPTCAFRRAVDTVTRGADTE